MPLFKVIGRGSLITAKQGVIPPGGTVEMSDADAASMPSGVIEALPVAKPLLLVAPPSVAPVTPPAAPAGAVRPTHSYGSKRVKDTKP